MLENIPLADHLTKTTGLVKGDTACNRSACQSPLNIGERFWNDSTRAYYCASCARKINQANPGLCVKMEHEF